MIDWATSKPTLREQYELSLAERGIDFELEHGVQVSRMSMRRIYKSRGVTWQKNATRVGNPKLQPASTQREMINKLKAEILELQLAGYEICQLDEVTWSVNRY